jgi:hypothetical protein
VEFYATAAEMFPVLFLAIAWDSGYFKSLKGRTDDKAWFWKRRQIRWFGIVLCTWNILSIVVALLVLAGLAPDWIVLRLLVMVGLVVSAGTLLYRIYAALRDATKTK